MSKWKEYNLVEITEPIKETYNPTGKDNLVYIGLEHIEQKTLRLNGVGNSIDVSSNKFRFEAGDVLFGKLRPYFRKVVQPNFAGICSTDIWVLRAKEGFYQNFLYYFIANWDFVNLANSGEGGTRMPRADWNFLKKTEWIFPSLPEQRAIATILSSLDNKIDLLHRQNTTLEAMAETLFKQWFVEEAKEDWEEGTLSKIIDIVIDNRGKTPPTVDYKTEYPLIEVNALNSNSCLIDYSVIRKYVSKGIFGSWFRKHLNLNDVIISTVGTIGVFSIHLSAKGCIAQNLVGLRSKNISGYFIYNFLKVNKENILNLDIGGVQPSIKVPHLLDLKMKLPSVGLINKFHTTVDEYYKKIAINSNQIRTLTALRDTLLPKLMSGEVRVNINEMNE
jgi:type I restriction enzyme S subunit